MLFHKFNRTTNLSTHKFAPCRTEWKWVETRDSARKLRREDSSQLRAIEVFEVLDARRLHRTQTAALESKRKIA